MRLERNLRIRQPMKQYRRWFEVCVSTTDEFVNDHCEEILEQSLYYDLYYIMYEN